MLNQTQKSFEKIRNILLRKQSQVEVELKELEKKDPVMSDALAESSEPGTESWMADVHNQVVAAKFNLQSMLKGIRTSLAKMKSGKYGKCENCGNQIEEERLKAMPSATLCVSCSKKTRK